MKGDVMGAGLVAVVAPVATFFSGGADLDVESGTVRVAHAPGRTAGVFSLPLWVVDLPAPVAE
jgi:hypothetical protein